MIKFDITEYNFSKKDTEKYKLSILLGMDSFAYVVQDARATVLALREYHWANTPVPDTLWQEDERLSYAYRQVNIALDTLLFSIVPHRLFQPAEKATYLGHLAPLENSEHIFHDHLVQHQAELIYGLSTTLVNTIERYLPFSYRQHLHKVLLEAMRSHAAVQKSYHLACHIWNNRIYVYAFDRTNLLLANGYTYRSAQDLLYYLLLVYDQLNLKTDEVPLALAGRLRTDAEVYKLLHRYIRHLSFLPSPAANRGPQLERHPTTYFYDLFAIGAMSG